MDTVAAFIFSFQGLIFGAFLVALVYLIFRRIRIKKTETFEDREN